MRNLGCDLGDFDLTFVPSEMGASGVLIGTAQPVALTVDGSRVVVMCADLEAIYRSKKPLDRPKDQAALRFLEQTLSLRADLEGRSACGRIWKGRSACGRIRTSSQRGSGTAARALAAYGPITNDDPDHRTLWLLFGADGRRYQRTTDLDTTRSMSAGGPCQEKKTWAPSRSVG